jgi:NADPH:quinone reductase-like Zn-dependent oxidoreductase
VLFGASVETLRQLDIDTLIEIGPHPTLVGMAQHVLAATGEAMAGLPSLRRGRDEWQTILDSVAALYTRGSTIDWAGLDSGAPRQKLALPTYAFQRSRYWVDLPLPGMRDNSTSSDAHPLLGRMARSPLLKQILFEARLSTDHPAFLADHEIYGKTIFPGTAYLEMALAAAHTTGAPPRIASLSLREPIILAEHTATVVQLVLTPDENGNTSLQIISFSPDLPGQWLTHATGALSANHASDASMTVDAAELVDLAALQAACPETLDTDEYYHDLAAIGLAYGPAFRGLMKMSRGDGCALGFVQLPESAGTVVGYHIHPALLDACFHVIGATMPAEHQDDPDAPVYVPVGMSGVRLYRTVANSAWCYVQLSTESVPGAPTLNCRMQLLDEAGNILAVIDRLDLMQVPRGGWDRVEKIDTWFHQVVWRRQRRQADESSAEPGAWLVIADEEDAGTELAHQLMARGCHCTLAVPGHRTGEREPGLWQIDVHDPQAFHALRDALREAPVRGIVAMWASPALAQNWGELWSMQREACSTALHLAQSIADGTGTAPRLWLVTNGALAIEGDGAPNYSVQASLWGLGRVIARELPALHCTCVDLDRSVSSAAIAFLAEELVAPGVEDQIALRGSERYVARLVPRAQEPVVALGRPHRMEVPEGRALGKLPRAPMDVRAPEPGEIALEVHATGLNLHDGRNTLGLECAGVVMAVGQGVDGLRPGDAVVTVSQNAFDAVIFIPARLAVRKPANLSFAEAVSSPSTFMAARFAMGNLTRLQSVTSVLIHAAAGSIGAAAAQIAQLSGAEIIYAANSPTEHTLLRSLGVRHVISSHMPDFLERIMDKTGGRGIDVVVNSQSDVFLASSLAALARDGCFLEIGKRDIQSVCPATGMRPDALHIVFDPADMVHDEPQVILRSLRDALTALSEGSLKPLPLRAFPAEGLIDAQDVTAKPGHFENVVVTHRPMAWRGLVQPDSSYLITGGLGGLGLRVAQWLVERGARHVVLLSRNSPSPEAAATVAALGNTGARIRVLATDVTQPDDVARAVASIEPPLRGVIHAAGVLDDGMLSQQTWSRFEHVLAPKMAGAWNLHTATRGAALDFFVMFSSASAVLGNPGQANYAAANAFLDAFAHQRRADGLPALTIGWGAWAEIGMAARLDPDRQSRRASQGIASIAPEQGLLALERAMLAADPYVAILPVRWSTLLGQFPDESRPPLLTELGRNGPAPWPGTGRTNGASADDALSFRGALGRATPSERVGILALRITQHVCRVMGLEPTESPEPTQPLSELGLDSLMAVELKNRIDADLLTSLHISTLLQGPTIAELSERLVLEYAKANAGEIAAVPPAPLAESSDVEHILANLDQLTDEAVDAMLDAMLKEQKETE